MSTKRALTERLVEVVLSMMTDPASHFYNAKYAQLNGAVVSAPGGAKLNAAASMVTPVLAAKHNIEPERPAAPVSSEASGD